MAIENPYQEQPELPEERPEQPLETAMNNLKLAGFMIGQKVNIPDADKYPPGQWVVMEPTFLTDFGRTVPGVVVRNEENFSIITVRLQDLCTANPIEDFTAPTDLYMEDFYHTSIPAIGEDLTKGKLLYFHRIEDDKKIMMGMLDHTIEVGQPIKGTLLSTTKVTKITLEGNEYKITTESGSIYIFDPSESLPAFITD
ncbi:MAG: hypothetical protein ABID64_04535 [Nitrospirota bacterium]